MSGAAVKRLVYALPDRIERDDNGQAALRWTLPGAPFEADASWAENPAVSTVRVLPGAFSPDACRRMIALGDTVAREQGELEKGDPALRRSEVSWIPPSEASTAFYHRVGVLLHQANLEYRFVLRGLAEPLQIARYGVGGHFDWHIDSGLRETAGRKLSLTVQLSDDADYEGGNLEFINIHGRQPARGLGTAIIFPSFLAHRIAPVTRGVRVSIVAWAYGPSFV